MAFISKDFVTCLMTWSSALHVHVTQPQQGPVPVLDSWLFLFKLLIRIRRLRIVVQCKVASQRVRGADDPMVIVCFSFMGVQKCVSCHLVLFSICGPAGTEQLP